MLSSTKSIGTALTAFMVLTALAMLWLVAMPNGMAPASFLLVGLVLSGLVVIGRLNHDNSQETVPAVVRPSPVPERAHRA